MSEGCKKNGEGEEEKVAASCEGRAVVEHCPGWLTLYSDGTFLRLTDLDRPACPLSHATHVASRDVVIHSPSGIWARIFLPLSATLQQDRSSRNAPVVLHFHGGGFCVGSPSSPSTHDFCTRMANKSSCIWISVYYRLAPEHRLPAAFRDAYTALLWLHSQGIGGAATEDKPWPAGHGEKGPLPINDSRGTVFCEDEKHSNLGHDENHRRQGHGERDPWLAQYADLSNCFIAGESAGGTMVHFLATEAAGKDWSPLNIAGLLMIHPAFVEEEPKVEAGSDLSQERMRFYNRSALPEGASFGHPFLNPMHPDAPIKLTDLALPPVLLAVAEKDPLRSGALLYFHALLKSGQNVQLFESLGVGHCFHNNPDTVPSATETLEDTMTQFIIRIMVRKRRENPIK